MSPAVKASLFTIAVVAVGVAVTWPTPRPRKLRRTNPGRSYAATVHAPAVQTLEPELPEEAFGLLLSDEDLEVEDWNSWMAWGPKAVREALDDGAKTGQQIAAHLMRRAFPDRSWPPTADDPLAHRWRTLVRGIDRALETMTPEDDERRNVIQLHR